MNQAALTRLFVLAGTCCVAACGADADADTMRDRGNLGMAGFDNPSSAGASGAAGMNGANNPPGSMPPVIGGVPSDDDSDDDSCGAVEQMAQNRLQPADIIWAIDNSGSMTEEALAVQQNMNDFATRLVSSGIDVHLAMISTTNAGPLDTGGGGWASFGGGNWASFGGGAGGGLDFANECQGSNGVCIAAPFGSGNCPDDSNLPSFLHLLECVNSWNPLTRIVELQPMWASMLRPDASKHIVVVTDDDSTMGHLTADGFISAVNAFDPPLPNWKFHGIFSFTDCPSASAVGTVYRQLVDQTGGVAGDLCTQDFTPVFDALVTSVVQGSSLACDWAIPPPPDGETFSPDKVNVKVTPSAGAALDILRVPPGSACGDQGGWHFDDEATPSKVVACPATCDSLQADAATKVSVLFGCKSRLVPLE